jgi:DNA primase
MKDIESVKSLIKEHVSLGELLKADGRITNSLDEEQFSCTFHGIDRKKSARYYRTTDTAYCWVCKEKWDAISYIRKKEGTSFGETINRIVKDYSIDISKLPEATEEHVRKLQEKTAPKIDNRKLATERLRQAILSVKGELKTETYSRFVYAYMVLKYMVPDNKFEEQCVKLKSGMLRVFEKLQK